MIVFLIKNIRLYLIFLLFPFAVYSMSDCESALSSTSEVTKGLSKEEVLEFVNNPETILSEANASRKYKLQYYDRVLGTNDISPWMSFEQLVRFVNGQELSFWRHTLQYRPIQPGENPEYVGAVQWTTYNLSSASILKPSQK